MAEYPITFHSQHPTFRMRDSGLTKKWLTECAAEHSAKIQGVHYLFCSDEHMLKANRQFLDHDYYTDILTFPGHSSNGISGDILISIDRVRDNARTQNQSPQHELARVMAHGVLHLIGYRDDTDEHREEMRQAENRWIRRRFSP